MDPIQLRAFGLGFLAFPVVVLLIYIVARLFGMAAYRGGLDMFVLGRRLRKGGGVLTFSGWVSANGGLGRLKLEGVRKVQRERHPSKQPRFVVLSEKELDELRSAHGFSHDVSHTVDDPNIQPEPVAGAGV
jgi:hypothetical protein